MKKQLSRRNFLVSSAGMAGGVGLGAGAVPLLGRPALDGTIRWGVIGVGNRARAHIEAFNELDCCGITALCDIREEALQQGLKLVKGNQATIKLLKNYQDLLEQKDVDAVCIVTPNHLHKQMTIDSLAAGKHVLCEKPMAVSMEECDEVVVAAKKSDRVLQYGMQLRHTPTYMKVNELVNGGAIGKLRYAWVSDFRQDFRQLHKDPAIDRAQNWRYSQKTSGGTLLEYSIHRLDLLNWWMNSRPVVLSAFGGLNVWKDRETIDHCGILLEYSNGGRASYGMTLYSRGYRAPWVLMGDEGQMLVSGNQVTIQKGDVSNDIGGPKVPPSEEVIELPREGNGTKLQYVHFLKAVKGEAAPYPNWRIAYDAMWVGIQGEVAIQKKIIVRA